MQAHARMAAANRSMHVPDRVDLHCCPPSTKVLGKLCECARCSSSKLLSTHSNVLNMMRAASLGLAPRPSS